MISHVWLHWPFNNMHVVHCDCFIRIVHCIHTGKCSRYHILYLASEKKVNFNIFYLSDHSKFSAGIIAFWHIYAEFI